eukprot:2250650-Pleurochrysis_carterae.AAC.1
MKKRRHGCGRVRANWASASAAPSTSKSGSTGKMRKVLMRPVDKMGKPQVDIHKKLRANLNTARTRDAEIARRERDSEQLGKGRGMS